MATFRLILALSAQYGWNVNHMHIEMALLNPRIDQGNIYMEMPNGIHWLASSGRASCRRASGKKFCVRTLHTRRKRLDAQGATRQGILCPDNACQRTCGTEREPPVRMRTRQKWTAHWPYGRLMSRQTASGRCMPRHLPSGRGVSGHLPSGRSACISDAECQGRCRPDEECQGICLLDASRVSRRRMSRQMSSGRCMPRHLPSSRGVSGHLPSGRSACITDAECQGRCRPDEECQGICLQNADRKSTRLNSSHPTISRMPSSA